MLEPRPHQANAIRALETPHTRAWVQMACGTGKTLVARRASYHHAGPQGVVAVFSPSKRLNRQNHDAWAADTDDGLDGLLVYSDADGTTDPARVARFITNPSGRRRVIFCTYQSASVIAQAYRDNPGLPPLDVIAEDEAHLTASMAGNGYSMVLFDEFIPARRRMAFTATPRVHTNPEQGTSAVASMDNPGVYGPRVYELTFGRAISEYLIRDFRVAVITVTDADLHRLLTEAGQDSTLPSSVLASQVAMAHAIRDYGLRSVLAFHGRVERSEAYTASLAAICQAVGAPPVVALHMDGTTSASERDKIFAKLAHPDPGTCTVLSSVRTISEGVDVPAIQAVEFADARSDPSSIAQCVGRSLRRPADKVGIEQPDEDVEAAVVVLPVYLAPGEDAEVVLQSSRFATVWSVLAALRDFDERLDSELAKASMKAVRVSLRSPVPVEVPDRIEIKTTGMDALPPGLADKLRTAMSAHLMSLGDRRPKWPAISGDLVFGLIDRWCALLDQRARCDSRADHERIDFLRAEVAREMRDAVGGSLKNSKIPSRAFQWVGAMFGYLDRYERWEVAQEEAER